MVGFQVFQVEILNRNPLNTIILTILTLTVATPVARLFELECLR